MLTLSTRRWLIAVVIVSAFLVWLQPHRSEGYLRWVGSHPPFYHTIEFKPLFWPPRITIEAWPASETQSRVYEGEESA